MIDAAGPGRLALLERREDPQGRVALDLEVHEDPAELGAHRGVLQERPPAPPERPHGPEQLAEGRGVAGHARERAAAPLVGERGLRDLPALAEAPHEIRLLDARVGHEDLGEVLAPGDLAQRAHLDAGLAHREQEARDALVLRPRRCPSARGGAPSRRRGRRSSRSSGRSPRSDRPGPPRACGGSPDRSPRRAPSRAGTRAPRPSGSSGGSAASASSVPCTMMVGPTIARPRGLMGAGAPARAISSATIACWSGVAPRPPYATGQPIPT